MLEVEHLGSCLLGLTFDYKVEYRKKTYILMTTNYGCFTSTGGPQNADDALGDKNWVSSYDRYWELRASSSIGSPTPLLLAASAT
jgi:hypothetical protein